MNDCAEIYRLILWWKQASPSGSFHIGRDCLVSNEDYDAIDIDDSTIAGDVVNTVTGDITGEDGIDIDDSTVVGSVVNAGTITADDEGFDIDQSDIGSDLANSGLITAGGLGIVVEGDMVSPDGPPPAPGAEPPPPVIDYVSIGGSFVNSGEIISAETGISMEYVDIAGDFNTAEGSVEAGMLEDGQLATGIDLANVMVGGSMLLGDISASETGVNFEKGTVGGDFVAAGDISAVQGNGIFLSGVDIAGVFDNSGDITAGQKGIVIQGDHHFDADGVLVTNVITSIGGSFSNSGDISSGDHGITVVDTTVGGDFGNSGNITSNNHGISLHNMSIVGNLVNSGDIEAGNNAINVEGMDGNVTIGGFIHNSGDLSGENGIRLNNDGFLETVTDADGVINARSDGFYIDNTHIKGNVINHGTIVAKEHNGIDIQVDDIGDGEIRTRIDGNLVSTGNITAGDNGFELDGEWDGGDTVETPDGTVVVPIDVAKLEIGGAFYNSGVVTAQDSGIDLELVSVGANGVLADGQANFENHGMITAGEDAGIKLVASDVAGDFINAGDISVVNNAMYSEGDEYRLQTGDGAPEGDVTLTAVGADTEGNSWFRIKNEGTGWAPMSLMEQGGGFDSGHIGIGSGEEVYITVGNNSDGSESYVLILDDGPFGPVADGELAIAAADLGTSFQPAYKIVDDETTPQRGISLTGKLYAEGEEYEQLIKTTIGGSFKNAGNISALDEGIYLSQVDVGGDFVNEGNVESLTASAIDLSDVSMGGNFVNKGDLNADQPYLSKEGDSYREQWDGTPSEDGQVVFESKGVDENGNQWVVIRNESDSGESFTLGESAGDFATTEFYVGSGEEVYVNIGTLDGDAELKHAWGDGEVVATAGSNEDGFSRVFEFRNGISVVDADIGGHFVNEGNIAAVDEGIYLDNVSIGGQIENRGDISSDATGIMLNDAEVDGAFLNSGKINAGWEGIFIANSTLAGGVGNTADITAFGGGIHISNSTLDGNVINTANISVSAVDDGYSAGMVLDAVDGVGAFVNEGEITAEGNQYTAGMGAGNVNMNGAVENTGTITSSGIGIALNNVDGATLFANSGTINAEGGAGMQATNSAITRAVANSGSITASKQGVLVANTTLAYQTEPDGEVLFSNVGNTEDGCDQFW